MQPCQDQILRRIHTLGVEELRGVNTLHLLDGDYLNLECRLPNGTTGKILDDRQKYWAAQVAREGSGRCFGIAADDKQIAVFEYGCNGADAELVLWVKL